jgi:lysine 2,3-aminomutase
MGEERAILRNYEGVITAYTWPAQAACAAAAMEPGDAARYRAKEGVAALLSGESLCLEPEGLQRKKRKR